MKLLNSNCGTRFALLLLLAISGLMPARAATRDFVLGGDTIRLEDVTADTTVYFSSMRLNRAVNAWNVEAAVSNRSARVLAGPMVLLVESATGTSGLLQADGVSSNQAFVDLSAQMDEGVLSPANATFKRTLSLGFTAGTPAITTRVYALAPTAQVAAAAFLRSLNDVGQPLGGVQVDESSPGGQQTRQTDPVFGVATVGQSPGETLWKFTLPDHLPVWRQQVLGTNGVELVIHPRLTRRSTNSTTLTPLGGGVLSNEAITITFAAGSVNSNQPATLTPLTPQTLPALLPLGWSPLQAFWLEFPGALQGPLDARIRPIGPISRNETAVLAQWDTSALRWQVTQTLAGNGDGPVDVALPGAGAFALVVGDIAPNAPPAPQLNQPLPAATTPLPDATNLTAGGVVVPSASPASLVPELVTGTATVMITNSAGALPSGFVLRCDVREDYRMSDGTRRVTPRYDHFIVGYQRPGDVQSNTLHSVFPIRPLVLFDAGELEEAIVRVDVLPPGIFGGTLLTTNGGLVAGGNLRILASSGDLDGSQAALLRSLDPADFAFLSGGLNVPAAFDLSVSGVATGQQLTLQMTGAPSNALLVLARVLHERRAYGIEPVERLATDAQGRLFSLETNTTDRLPGITGAGQYLLVQVNQPQALVRGVARNAQGQPTAGLLVRLAPWTTLSRAPDGSFLLLAPAGTNQLAVTDLVTGDVGETPVLITPGQTVANPTLDTALSGPRVVTISPTNNAVSVPRVTSVVINFSRPLNPATLLNDAVRLVGASNQPIASSVSLNLANTRVTLLPSATLDPATQYRVLLATNIADTTGRFIEGPTQFAFTTVPLSARDTAAQLIIYEPGATNVPTNILAQIPAYVPGSNRNDIVVRGTPGVADPGVAVILANESTGETTTVLSKPDGSFVSVIEGTEEDFVSATFINLNGTRVYVPVSRQEFDNGFVGLYRQGGILEAQSDGGPVQIYIQPEAIQNRAKLRMQTLSASELRNLLGGVEPEAGIQIAASAFKLEVSAEQIAGGAKVTFPINLTSLGFPTNLAPQDAALALTIAQDVNGVKAFEVRDQLRYVPQSGLRPGTVRIQEGITERYAGIIDFAIGFLPGGDIFQWVIVPLLIGKTPITVAGKCIQAPSVISTNESFLSGVTVGLINQASAAKNGTPLSGAFVTLRQSIAPPGLPGRLNPGMVYSQSGQDGRYLMVAPVGDAGYVITATHPRFEDKQVEPVFPLFDLSINGTSHKDFVFFRPTDLQLPPQVNIARSPLFPAPGQNCTLQVTASQGIAPPPNITAELKQVVSLADQRNLPLETVTLGNIQQDVVGNVKRWTATVRATNAVRVVVTVNVTSSSGTGNSREPSDYKIDFAGAPPPPPSDNPIPPSDPNSTLGPVVVASFPPEDGYVPASGQVLLRFNEPIDRTAAMNANGVFLSGPGAGLPPYLQLSDDQKELTMTFAGLQPNGNFTLILTPATARDLSGNPLDQKPSTTVVDNFSLTFHTPPTSVANLPEIKSGFGSAVQGSRLYALDRGDPNYLFVYDISVPSAPRFLSKTIQRGMPRDLVVLPKYEYKLKPAGPAFTNDLVAVVGGDLVTHQVDTNLGAVTTDGQYLRIYNAGDPGNLVPLATLALTYRIAAVPKVRWEAPNLTYLEFGADVQQIGVIDLQELLIGFSATRQEQDGFPDIGDNGVDKNGDGDYADVGERVPKPLRRPPEFYGKKESFVVDDTTQNILDFSFVKGTLGVTLGRGQKLQGGKLTGISLNPAFRTISYFGQNVSVDGGTYYFEKQAHPKRVTVIPALPIRINGQLSTPVVALVSLAPDADGKQKLAILDITLPETPKPIQSIIIPDNLAGGTVQSVTMGDDGSLQLATSRNLIRLNPLLLAEANPPDGSPHPSILSVAIEGGSSTYSQAKTSYGVVAVNEGGRNQILQSAPPVKFVTFPEATKVVDPTRLPSNDADLQELLDSLRVANSIFPARREATFDIASDLSPPSPRSHYHVMIEAPGGVGAIIQVGLESLNRAGKPLGNLGMHFPPTRAETPNTLTRLKQTPRTCDANIRPLTAYRMSADPQSPFYNRYLSKPFALTYEKITADQLKVLQAELDREILWSGSYLRAFIDPDMAGDGTIGIFAAHVNASAGTVFPIAGAVARTLDLSYVMGDNPPPAAGFASLPGTAGMVSAHNAEMRSETVDFMVPGPRMPIVFQRAIGNQDTFSGPFGRGWDFNYNQRLTELEPSVFPSGLSMPLVVRRNKAESEIGGSQDLLFHTGAGRTIHFSRIGSAMPPEYAQDPLVLNLKWDQLVSDYYLPEKGSFDLLVKFKDGYFERLTSGGVRFRYANNGRLEEIIDRFPKNRHVFDYDRRGLLTRITDRSVTDDHYLELGYYRFRADPDFNGSVDIATDVAAWDGKVFKLRDYAGGDVLFFYDEDGVLVRREGVQLAGENGGYSGRIKTYYLYHECQFRGIAQSAEGKPEFVGQNLINSKGKPVAQAGSGASGNVQVTVPPENTAANVENQTSSGKEADGTTTSFKFNKHGYPSSIAVTGKGGTAETKPEINDYGQVTSVLYPEGNSQSMRYDTNNPIFRSRGNLLELKVDPGPRGGESYTQTFSYDPWYNLPSGQQQDANGFIRTYGLTPDRREIGSIQYGSAGSDSFAYNDNGQKIQELDHRGIETTYDYASSSGFLSMERRGGNTYQYDYSGDYASRLGRPSTVTPPLGTATKIKYNANLQQVEVALGERIQRFGYDDLGRAFHSVQLVGSGKKREQTYTFNDQGFLTVSRVDGIEVNGAETFVEYHYTPDEVSRVKTIQMPGGAIQSFEYDARGDISRMTVGSSYSEEYERDLHGNVKVMKQGGDVVQTMTYDGHDRVINTTRKTGTGDEIETAEYYRGGQVKSVKVTDPQFGVVKEQTFDQIDALGRPVQVTVHGGVISPSYVNTYAALTHRLTGPRYATTTTWDKAGYQTGYSDPLSSSVIVPDANGRIKQVDWLQDSVTYSDYYDYNGLDQVVGRRDNLGPRVGYLPRADGLSLAITNARGFVTTMDYSSLGDTLSSRRSDGVEFRYKHNAEHQPSFVGDKTSAGFTYSYDADMRLREQTLRNGAAITYGGFDPRNLPTAITMPGGTMNLTYDLQRRLTRQTINYQATTREEAFTYDALGRVRVETYRQDSGGANTASYSYDKAGPLLSVRFQEDGGDHAVSYEYYADASRKSVTYPSGVKVSEDRDVKGRLLGISDAGGNIARVTQWKGMSQPAAMQLGATIQIFNQYDERGRLTGSRVTRQSDGAVLVHLRLNHDLNDNTTARQFLHRGGKTDVFGYDSGDRITRAQFAVLPADATGTGPAMYERSFEFEATGLDYLTKVTTTGSPPANAPPFASTWGGHDAFLLPDVVDAFSRGPADPMGNVGRSRLQVRLAGALAPQAMTCTMEHNGLGSLVRVTRSDAAVIENQFRPGGLRYSRKVTRGQAINVTAFVYDDAARLIEEYDRSGSQPLLIARYYYANGDSPVAADLRDGGGQLRRYYYLRDEVQSVIAVADESGRVVERVWYDAFGQPVLEGRDTAGPVIRSVMAGGDGSLLVALSEPVTGAMTDPGPGSGIVGISNRFGLAVTLRDSAQNTITGAVSLVESFAGTEPRSVLRFIPSQAAVGQVSLTLAAGGVADEWGNTNLVQVVTANLVANASTGTVFYAAQPQVDTSAPRLARSSIGSPFLFHGQYFDYDTGLVYLRARFYDPFAGLFLEPDPDGYEDSVNLYAAFAQNPVSRRDPTGRNTADIMRIIARVIRKEEAKLGKAVDTDLMKSAVRVERSLGSVETEGAVLFKGMEKHWDAVESALMRSSVRRKGGFQPFEDFPEFATKSEDDLLKHLEGNGFMKVKMGARETGKHPLVGTDTLKGQDPSIPDVDITKNMNSGGSDIWFRFHLDRDGRFKNIEAVRIDGNGHFVNRPGFRVHAVEGSPRKVGAGELPHFHKEIIENPREAGDYVTTGLQYKFDDQGFIPANLPAGSFRSRYVGATAFDDTGRLISTRAHNELIKLKKVPFLTDPQVRRAHTWLAMPDGLIW